MTVKIQEVLKNNFVIDASGIGVKQFEFSPSHLGEIIESDLTTNYDCITYITSTTKVEEGIYVATNTRDNTRLDIRLYFKTSNRCEDRESMLGIIEAYLSQAFIN